MGLFSQLEHSNWENKPCQLCGGYQDDGALLLCDGQGKKCNAVYHYYCIGLDCVPMGDWFCPRCQTSRDAAIVVVTQDDATTIEPCEVEGHQDGLLVSGNSDRGASPDVAWAATQTAATSAKERAHALTASNKHTVKRRLRLRLV